MIVDKILIEIFVSKNVFDLILILISIYMSFVRISRRLAQKSMCTVVKIENKCCFSQKISSKRNIQNQKYLAINEQLLSKIYRHS